MEKNIKIGENIYCISSDDGYLDAMGVNFEPYMVDLFRTLINPDDVIADIGANIGLTAILFSSLARKVFAFEPSPSTYRILTNNLDLAAARNVEPINIGLGDKAESLTITFANNNRSGGYVSQKIRPDTGHVTEKIQVDTLDNLFASGGFSPNFLKIDVEGFELNVIKGGGRILRENKPTVVMEMNHFCLDVLQRVTIPDFLDFMRSVFPHLYAIDTDNATIADLHDPDRAYFVMHEHVVHHRFPNLVGGFDKAIKAKLESLAASANESIQHLCFKTPVVFKPEGSMKASSIPATVTSGESFEIVVTLKNDGDDIWYGYGSHPVLLSYHWKYIDGKDLVYDGIRSELKRQIVDPRESLQDIVSVVAPSEKGNFFLILTLLQEGVCWFEDMGFEYASGMVKVV